MGGINDCGNYYYCDDVDDCTYRAVQTLQLLYEAVQTLQLIDVVPILENQTGPYRTYLKTFQRRISTEKLHHEVYNIFLDKSQRSFTMRFTVVSNYSTANARTYT